MNDAVIISKCNEIEKHLNDLCSLSLTVKFSVASERKIFFDIILLIKQLWFDIQRLIDKENLKSINPITMRMYISRIIHPKQMEAWIKKLCQNIQNFKNSANTKVDIEKILFIQDQYRLLDTVIKVLNGDAYFVGC